MSTRRRVELLACSQPNALEQLIRRDEHDALEETDDRRQRLDALLDKIPAIEREIILLTMDGKTQREISQIVGIAQQNVMRRQRTAVSRLRYHANMPDVDHVQMARDMYASGISADEVAVIVVYLSESCVSVTARRLGMKLRRVRRIVENADHMLGRDATLSEYLEAVKYVRRGGLLGRRTG